MRKSVVLLVIGGVLVLSGGLVKGISELNAEAKQRQVARQEQIADVKDISSETTFETTDQEEANQLISEIQNSGKKVVKLEVKNKMTKTKTHQS